MLRLLLIVAVVLAIALAVRRAVVETLREGRESRRPRGGKRDPRAPTLPPERLVCESCGTEFEPDATGWICPKCGK